VHSLKADAQFVNSIAQEVGFGPPQFVAHFPQPLHSEITLVLHFGVQFAEPFQEWA